MSNGYAIDLKLSRCSDGDLFKIIDKIHHEVHEGEYFHAGNYSTGVASMAKLAYLLEFTSTEKEFHFTYNASAAGAAIIRGYEVSSTSTLSSTGTAMVCYNRKRGSTTTSYINISAGVASTSSLGAAIYKDIIPGTTSQGGAITSGGASRQNLEWILSCAGSSRYWFELENFSANTYQASVQLDWYEESI